MIKYLENKDDFDKIVNDNKILIDFYADWCGPCRMLGETLKELDFDILKVNVDDFKDIALKHGVMSIPCLVLYDHGKIINKTIGYQNLEELKKIIQ